MQDLLFVLQQDRCSHEARAFLRLISINRWPLNELKIDYRPICLYPLALEYT